MSLTIEPTTFAEACAFVEAHHRHHVPPQGHKFSVALSDDGEVVGVAMVGRPVNRILQRDPYTLECTRLCCIPGHKGSSSKLLATCWRAARALGFRRMVTYTLPEEGGASLRGAGFRVVAETSGGSWSRGSRPRVDKHPLQGKLRWEKAL